MMSRTRWSVLLATVAVAVCIGVAGCPPTTSDKTVLAGTWTLVEQTNPNALLTSAQLNFDSTGELVSVTYVFNNATATKTLSNTSTSVSGTAVTVTSSDTSGGFTLSFTGTLNSTDTVITGTASWTLVIGATTITAPTGAATLTKVTPVTKTVLAGNWTLAEQTNPNALLTSIQLNFNSSGDLVSTTYIFNNVTATKTLTNTTTAVNGTTVTITSSDTSGGFTLAFNGTLNSANTVITGTASWTLVIGATTITAPAGPATLTKVVVTGNSANGQTLFNADCVGCHSAASVAPGADLVVPNANLGTINSEMNGIILTDQEAADIQAFLATQ